MIWAILCHLLSDPLSTFHKATLPNKGTGGPSTPPASPGSIVMYTDRVRPHMKADRFQVQPHQPLQREGYFETKLAYFSGSSTVLFLKGKRVGV